MGQSLMRSLVRSHRSLTHSLLGSWDCGLFLSTLQSVLNHSTVGSNDMKSTRRVLETIRSSVRSFARTAHSFACSALLASLARSAALIHSLAGSLTHSGAHGEKVYVYRLNTLISCSLRPLCGSSACRLVGSSAGVYDLLFMALLRHERLSEGTI